jgi:hypothetical protein
MSLLIYDLVLLVVSCVFNQHSTSNNCTPAPTLLFPHKKFKTSNVMTFFKTPLPISSFAVDITELLLRSQAQRLTMSSHNSLPPSRSTESRLSILERAIAALEEDDEDVDDINIDQAHEMTFSKTPRPVSPAVDLSELLLRSQTKRFTTNNRNSLSPSRSRENLLSILERSIADLDEQDDQDCDDINIDSVDWGRSSHHRNYDSHSEQ